MKSSLAVKVVAVLVVLATMLGTLATGCAQGGAQTPTAAKKDVVLRVGLDDFGGEQLDPILPNGQGARMLNAMYEYPLGVDQQGAIAPGIVKKWEVAADGLSWTFTLRDDVYFHPGMNADGTAAPRTKVVAKDVAFSYERSVAKDSLFASVWEPLLGKQPRIEVVDDATLRIYTNGPQPLFPAMSTVYGNGLWVVPKAYIDKNGLEYFRGHPIGTGPYKFVRHQAGDLIEFEAIDYPHWKSKPEFTRIIVYLVPEEATRMAMLEKGQLDASPASLDGALKMKAKGFTTSSGQEGQPYMSILGAYHTQAKGAPLGDVRVRQALSLAINRQEIIDTMFHGLASLPPPARVGWFTPDMTTKLRDKWQAWTKQNYRYDPAEATRLLKEAGYANGFTFDLWSSPDSAAPYLADLVVVLAGYWEKVGVHATIIPVDGATWKANRNVGKSTTLVGKMGSTAAGLVLASNVETLKFFTSKQGAMDLLIGSPNQAEVDSLYTQGMSSMDPAKTEQILDKLLEITTASWTTIPVLASPVLYVTGPRVNAYIPSTTQNLAEHFAEWKYTGKE